MQRLLLVIILASTVFNSYAQRSTSDTIVMVKRFGGYQYFKNDRQMSMPQLEKMFLDNEKAYKEIRAARAASTTSSVLGYIGGFCIGWPIGTAIGGGKPMWGMAAVGAGITAISIPISISANKKARSAVARYNAGITSNSSILLKEVKLNFGNDGIGLVMKF